MWCLTANWACCWIFCWLSCAESLSFRQPWSLKKVFIHHMCLCINKQNKYTQNDLNLATVRAKPTWAQLGIFVHSWCLSSNSFTLIRIDKKYNLYPVLLTLLKHRLLVSSCFFCLFLIFFFSFFCYISTVKFQFCDKSFLPTSQLNQCGMVMKIFTVTYKSI